MNDMGMNTAEMMLALEEDGDQIGECSVDEFCAANSETFDDVTIADLAHLGIGETLKMGGGAQPEWRVTRVA